MKTSLIPALLVAALFFAASCGGEVKKENQKVLTEKIQYPVFIKCPYTEETEWYRENMEGSDREKFVNLLFDLALEGKVKAYDYYANTPLTKDQVKAAGCRYDTISLTRPQPPYEEYDTVITQIPDRKLIHRVTFLEEWYFDEKNLQMEKKVVGIAPALTVYADSNEIKGYMPLFWIYLDKNYPEKK